MKTLCAMLAALALCAAAGCAGGAGRSAEGGGTGVTVFGDVDAAVTRTRSK